MKKQLAVVGAGGQAKVVADTALEAGWASIVFFDDVVSDGLVFGRWRFGGEITRLLSSTGDFSGIVVGIGANRVRLRRTVELMTAGGLLVTLVHPRAVVSRDAELGPGSVVFAGAVIQPGAVVGAGVIVNTGSTIDHDCLLGDGVHVCPGAHLAGGVSVGECAWVGVGSAVRQYVSIGADAVVGAGAAVVSNVAAGVTVVGVPARPLEGRV